jgi:hypothetical protein
MRQAIPREMIRRCLRIALAVVAISLASCSSKQPAPPKEPLWPTLPKPAVPQFMQGSLYERVRFSGLDNLGVYGYSLVVNLHDTGDGTAPTAVRDYIVKQMLLRGFDSYVMGRYEDVSPQRMLADKRVAIVSVEGLIPPGARSGQRFDIMVRALRGSATSSLAHGDLYQSDLSDLGFVDPQGIQAHIQAFVPGGPVFVNPAYSLAEGATTQPGSASALRTGTVMDGGIVRFDRPIDLQLREPQASTARYIEQIIARRWQAPTQTGLVNGDSGDLVAKAENEGLVLIYVPPEYKGDWRHFLGVVSHLYLDQSPEFFERKSRELVELAHQPNAPLADISLCWEAMGAPVLPVFEPLITDPNPDVAFAAARAAAFLGDAAARQALLQMALDASQPNQLAAVRTLGQLPDSAEVDQMIVQLLDSDRADVRIEAYRLLAQSSNLSADSSDDSDGGSSSHFGMVRYNVGHRFLLDVIPSAGSPMVYASTTGIPRVAVFGHQLALHTPITFTAMDLRFSISSNDGTNLLTMFYRDPLSPQPTDVQTDNDLPEILARLGGEGPDNQDRFDFSFGDVVAIARQLVESHEVYGKSLAENSGEDCVFELQRPPLETDDWTRIPEENLNGRPQGQSGVMSSGQPAGSSPRAGG